ncbi:MAG: hypothetical protein Q4B50_05865 [Bacillota bacterium]|nr:hypothetical protein [Bacillota bacterium]
MRSDFCEFSQERDDLPVILAEVEKCAVYNSLNNKQRLRLRLMAEELVCMLPELMKDCNGIFWLENTGMEYELHVQATIPYKDHGSRGKLLALSTSGKNAAAYGMMGKVRAATEAMISYLITPDVPLIVPADSMHFAATAYYTYEWSLADYINRVKQKEKEESWDELERSIVANLARDVVVGIKGKQVDIVVKINFNA